LLNESGAMPIWHAVGLDATAPMRKSRTASGLNSGVCANADSLRETPRGLLLGSQGKRVNSNSKDGRS